MKQLFLALLLLWTGLTAGAQSPDWTFAKTVSSATDVATDSEGNFYLTGTFSGSAQIGTRQLTSARPGQCLYVAKCRPTGQVLQVMQLEGATTVSAQGLAVDKDGNCFVAGSFLGTLTDASGQQYTSRTTGSGSDILLVKFGATGAVRWLRQADGTQSGVYGYSNGSAVAVDAAGNSYLTGRANGSDIRFETLTFGARRNQGFLASYTRQGQLRWARVFVGLSPGFSSSAGGGVAVDRNGSCYVSGFSFRGWSLDGTTVTGSGTTGTGNNLYLAKFDTRQGQLRWAQATPGDGSGRALALDQQGDIYLGGDFIGTAAFGSSTLTSVGETDGFVARYDPDGSVDWATALGTPTADGITDLAVDPNSRKTFATGFLNTVYGLSGQAFLGRLNANGRVQEMEKVGGPGSSRGGTLALDEQNNVFTAGTFQGSCRFGAITLTSTAEQGYFGRYGRPGSQSHAAADPISIQTFPNPAHTHFTLRLTEPENPGAVRAALYNPQGRQVADFKPTCPASGVDVAFNTAGLPEGLYVLRITTGPQTLTRTISIRH
ncbi:T9SS type A sorting domain-containing protein [Hymenobacter persicinus]|uniref:T9SS type A sorting domain-containing protein n=1 Tax=Hymenobacter persicinus TaxID=2025506 RepID=A0A4Q5LBL4_9BACT|nr:T9SS type A sorting domain-containing protein [Hymenobacter persicinus]RYU79890.1 T9SS type A sorting domain-containing protein [Hymenobacter persicinus]